MHIPDGFMDAKVWVPAAAASAAALGYALRRTESALSRKQVPLVALIGSFIFAAQMINFPIAAGTSGHFLGGALAAILFGPWVGLVVMSAVLIVQAFVFQDGGITVLGANILCTGVIGCFSGYFVYRFGSRWLPQRWMGAAYFAAGWVSIVAAAFSVSGLLALSGTITAPFSVIAGAMVGWHSLIGIGEGVITALVAAYLVEREFLPNAGGVRA